MPIAYDGKVYEDYASFEAHTNPDIPDEIKQSYNPPAIPPQAPTEPAGALESSGSTETPARSLKAKLTGSDGGERYQLWPEKMVRSLIGGMALPGDVYQGKVAPDSIEAIERAADLAAFAVLGPAPLAKKMADGTLGSFAGVKSKTLDKGALEVAQAAEREGLGAEEIWRKTGFFKGADKRWRYEIDDSGATWNPPAQTYGFSSQGTSKLEKHLDHPELYAAYPELKDVRVLVDPFYPSRSAVWDGNMIRMGTVAAKDKGTVMHEVTHAIQDIEAFAQGGQPGKSGKEYKLKYEGEVDKLRKEYLNLQSKDSEMSGSLLLSLEEQGRLDYLRHVFQKYSEYARAGDIKARENYIALAGETEARNTQTRVDMVPKERFEISPMSTEDVRRSEQIVTSTPIYTTPYTGTPQELQALLSNKKASTDTK